MRLLKFISIRDGEKNATYGVPYIDYKDSVRDYGRQKIYMGIEYYKCFRFGKKGGIRMRNIVREILKCAKRDIVKMHDLLWGYIYQQIETDRITKKKT